MEQTHDRDTDPATTITAYTDGPLIVRGDFVIRDQDGTPLDPDRDTVALCRCGRSARKPFCDGTHRAVGFRSGTSVHRVEGGTGTTDDATGARAADRA